MTTPRCIALALILASAAPWTGCVRELAQIDMSDAGIRARVLKELKTRPNLDISLMQVTVHVRNVYLSGFVNSYESRRLLENTLRRVAGVRSVVNNTVVQE